MPPSYYTSANNIIKDDFDTIGHYALTAINSPLAYGKVPGSVKQTIVQPLLKKHNLDASIQSNYLPITITVTIDLNSHF